MKNKIIYSFLFYFILQTTFIIVLTAQILIYMSVKSQSKVSQSLIKLIILLFNLKKMLLQEIVKY